MKMTRLVLLFIIVLCYQTVLTQEIKKRVVAKQCKQDIRIDGILNEDVWKNNIPATDFICLRPFNGRKSSFETEVIFLYDNTAIYIGARLYDGSPDSILTYLSKRDEVTIVDDFGVYIDPFNDAQNAFGFIVTAAGVQQDLKSMSQQTDQGWDAVWESAVSIDSLGWNVEMKIPFSALRFPKTATQEWGLNIFRNIQRYRETDTWSNIDESINGINQQAGILEGIQDIESPLRLSFSPYLSSYIEKKSDDDYYGYSLKGGMDLKYGINESFTLDMMLIPDFGQVQSDDEVLNLSPFELQYDEKRAFFTEGTEMFSKGDIFYSRRIGGNPYRKDDVEDNLKDNEEVDKNPNETSLINATKVSGKTKKGLGIGVLNAITSESIAKIRDTLTNQSRNYVTQPLSNYNVLVLDQSLKNNSYASIINTNVNRFNDDYVSNVTATDLKFNNKSNSYYVHTKGALSQIFDSSEVDKGFYYHVEIGKSKGRFKYSLWQNVVSDTYNPNDFGFLRNNNKFSNELRLQYNFYQPFWRLLRWYNTVQIEHQKLYKPRKFVSLQLNYNFFAEFRNHFAVGGEMSAGPVRFHDYNTTRVENRYFEIQRWIATGIWISTDYSKRKSIDINIGRWAGEENNAHGYWGSLEPRLRLNNKFMLIARSNYNFEFNSLGYIDHTENEDTIYFGLRDQRTIINTFDINYIFSNKSSLSFRLRHYWSRVMYNQFYTLNDDGSVKDYNNYTQNEDINYIAFNSDLVYTWNFAPGSELVIVWKNQIDEEEDMPIHNFYDNLKETWNFPQTNSFSLKFLYYLDYWYLKKRKV